MKTEKNILIAFILNLVFSIFEFIGGIITNSISIISDSIHDIGDALSIGIAYLFEKKSKKKADLKYTYGYIRYRVLGSLITTSILLTGSLIVIYNSIIRIINPIKVNYDGMIIIAIFGVIINTLAAYFTKNGNSLNQKSVNLHMLEDVLGWIIVLIGAITIKFTNISIIDPILSILVSIFILTNTYKNFKVIIKLLLEKTPNNVNIENIKKELMKNKNIIDIHHIHIWSIDEINNCATMHVVVKNEDNTIKKTIREQLKKHNINHITIETELKEEKCSSSKCEIKKEETNIHHHHHHH